MLNVDGHRLASLARRHNAVLEMLPSVGDFVPEGAPLFRVLGGDGQISDREVTELVALGIERTMQQDVVFGLRQLVDIAERALSPAVNDPTGGLGPPGGRHGPGSES